jgi:glycosyltransferase involved in cell wall biosynthesis
MTIGIDIRVLASPHKSGIEEYTENLLEHILRLRKDINFKLFYCSYKKPLPYYPWLSLPNVKLYEFRIPNNFLFFGAKLFNWPKIDKMIGGVDVFFSPHFFMAPLNSRCRRVTTIHDLSFENFSEFLSIKRNVWHKLEMSPKKQYQLSDRIIAVSESTKNDLVSKYGIDSARVNIVHSGLNREIRRLSDSDLENFRADKKLPKNFLLFLSKIEPRKNVIALIEAFNQIKSRTDFEDLFLVLAGDMGWLCEDVSRAVANSNFKDRIVMADYINNEDRKFYYSLASAFIYPSFFEGFGFPPLEAMACGTPVITSANSSLPEVVGDGALLINPSSVDEIVLATESILGDGKLRKELIKRGLKQISNFDWRKTAEKTLDIIINA